MPQAFGASCARDDGRSLLVIPKRCSLCEQDVAQKPASLYWAWVNADGRRRAWKQKVCPDCFREHYVPLIVSSMEPVLICPSCGIGTADDYDAIYLTYCLPGMPQDQKLVNEAMAAGACEFISKMSSLDCILQKAERFLKYG